MRLEIARFLKDREQMLHYLAQQNVVPVKSPPWADCPFELRRNEKFKRGQVGQHLVSKGMAPLLMEILGVRDETSCRGIREVIKRLRKTYGYK
jgi:hypothetical protein